MVIASLLQKMLRLTLQATEEQWYPPQSLKGARVQTVTERRRNNNYFHLNSFVISVVFFIWKFKLEVFHFLFQFLKILVLCIASLAAYWATY